MINISVMKEKLRDIRTSTSFGEVHTVTHNMVISKGPFSKIGDICEVGTEKILCEVISIKQNNVYLMPIRSLENISIKDRVYVKRDQVAIPSVNLLLGRTLNGVGEFIDQLDPLTKFPKKEVDLNRMPPDPLKRKRIKDSLPTGIKAIDSLLTIGEGQKIGIFAGTGVGKSTLLGMIAKEAKADINVIALIGERGREVREFMERELGEEGMKRSVIVVATSVEAPLMLIKAAQLATSIAEEFRDQGKKVMFMMDSVSRFAKAREEIDNAVGLPTIQGKTPSMESYMKKILERSGMSEKGSITGIYTVLVDGDDFNDAIPDMARGILDGHIVLSRSLAHKNHYPAIDVLSSISRVMQEVADDDHWDVAREVKKYFSIYLENEDDFKSGMYIPGQDRDVDMARLLYPKIRTFLKQDIKEHVEFEETLLHMKGIFE